MKEYLGKWLEDRKNILELFRFDTEQPGNLKSNRELYIRLIKELNIEIERKEFFGLVKLYIEKGNIEDAFCKVCGKLCRCKGDYSFFDTCSRECGRILSAKTLSINYSNKTVKEKEEIKAKRRATNLAKYGVSTNLQNKEAVEKRIKKYGGNSVFASKEMREKVAESNRKKHNGQANSFQWEESKAKTRNTKLKRYGDENYRNKEKIKQTNLKKYGAKSYLATEECKLRTKQVCLEKYGVESYMQVPEIIEKIKANNRSKYGREGCISMYGVEYNCMRKDVRDKSRAKSKINVKWKEYLGLDLEEEYVIGIYSYDFKKKGSDILVEVNPTITHNGTMCIFDKDKPKNVLYHQNKTRIAEEAGYRCIHIWDWDEPSKIRLFLQDRQSIYARRCVIKKVSKEDCDIFLDTYHLQNSCKGQIVRLGLYYNNRLVEIMTFGRPRYNNKYEWELLRLCTIAGYTVIGGASKLFKEFLKLYNPNSIISYCDRSKFNGLIYSRLGFVLKKRSKPSKHWYNIKTGQHITDNLLRQLGVDKLLGLSYGKGTSNEQIMVEHNFLEVWDCGQDSYIWHKS